MVKLCQCGRGIAGWQGAVKQDLKVPILYHHIRRQGPSEQGPSSRQVHAIIRALNDQTHGVVFSVFVLAGQATSPLY